MQDFIKIALLVGLVALMLFLGGCDPMVERRGHIEEQALVEEITVGETSKDQVQRLLGSPSSKSSFGDESWYYVRAQQEAIGFFKPELTEQDVTQITFDAFGTVSDITHYGINDAQKVAIVDKTTPTEGHSLSFVEQLLGNLGRFNKSSGEARRSSSTRRP